MEREYLIEKGSERKYVSQADLAGSLKDGWELLGHRTVLGATVPQPEAPAETPRPRGRGKRAAEDKEEGQG